MTKTQKEHFIEFFRKQVDKFEDLSKKTFNNPTFDNVHDLRVNLRRISIVLWLMDFTDRHKDLKHLKKVLGKQRDLDVIIKNARRFSLDSNQLEKKLSVARKRTVRALTKTHRCKIISYLTKLINDLSDKSFDQVEKKIFNLKCSMNYWSCHTLNNNELHNFRLSLKKTRYAFESVGKAVSRLKKLQDCLGEAHDLEVLENKFKKTNGKLPQIHENIKLQKIKAKQLSRNIFGTTKHIMC